MGAGGQVLPIFPSLGWNDLNIASSGGRAGQVVWGSLDDCWLGEAPFGSQVSESVYAYHSPSSWFSPQVHYTFNKVLMLQEPLLVVAAFYILFFTVIIYVRLDFSITKVLLCLSSYQFVILHP